MTPPPAKRQRPWGKPWVTVLVLALMAVGAGVASSKVDADDFPKALRLDEELLFHSVLAVLIFLVIYMLAALATHTVVTGAPLKKMGLGQFNFEESAEGALVEGAATLEGMYDELVQLTQQADVLVDVSKETQEALVAVADALPSGGDSVRTDAQERIQRLERLAASDDEKRRETAEAVGRFKARFAEVEKALEQMGTRRGG